MLVSIIIPTYNRARLISRAVTSVIKQTHTAWELIIVDDGSTDETEVLIKPFLHDSRIRYYRKNNSGAAHSRNIGVEKSTGAWITFLDSDDEAMDNWLEEYVKLVSSENVAVLCCGLIKVNESNRIMEQILPQKMDPMLHSKVGRFTNGGVFMMRKEIFLAIGGYDNKLRSGQHTELAYRLMPYLEHHQIEIVNLFMPLVKVHIHGGERIRSNFRAKIEGVVYVLEKHKSLFQQYPITKSTYETNVAYYYRRNKEYGNALRYYVKAFKTYPSLKKFFRILVFFK